MKKIFFITLIISTMLFWQSIQSQCYMDRHSTTWYDGWVSCNTSVNPNTANPNSHWIMYDLGFLYPLYKTTIWNANEPKNLDYGIMEYKMEYSVNGSTWTSLGNFTLNQASGLSVYEGEEGPNFGGIEARYVLITAISNYGGSCYGLSEVKFNVDESLVVNDIEELGYSVTVYPNPFEDYVSIRVNTLFPNKTIKYSLYDLLGRKVLEDTLENTSKSNNIAVPTSNLVSGIYLVKISHNDKQKSFKIIKK